MEYRLSTFHGQTTIGYLKTMEDGKFKFIATPEQWLQLVTAAINQPTQYLHCDNDSFDMHRPITLRDLVSWIQRGDIHL